MPVYDYQCTRCGKRYDIFHKGREIREDVVCPDCGSSDHKKLISAPSPAVMASGSPSAGGGGGCCGGGACGIS